MKAILILVLMLCGSMSNAGTMTKREFQKDGVAYIEEIIIGENGNISKSIYPKRRLVVVETETPMRVQTMPDLKPLPAKTQKKSSNKPAKTLYRSIAACKRFHYSMRDPVTPDFIIQVTVNGFVKKKCKFTQTMPEGNVQTCLFSEEQRKDIGKRGELAFEPLLMDPTACVVSHP